MVFQEGMKAPEGQALRAGSQTGFIDEQNGSVHLSLPAELSLTTCGAVFPRQANEIFDLQVILNVFPMDVQKTMESILRQQAKAEGQMAAIRKLIQTGMRMIVKNEESIKELAVAQRVTVAKLQGLAVAQKELAAAQKVTETKLQGLIDAWRRSGNGRQAKN